MLHSAGSSPVRCSRTNRPLAALPQGIKHTRRAMRAQGLDPGSVSQPGTPASCASPLAGSRSTSPSRGPRGRHSRHGSADWGGAAGGVPSAEPAPESLICSVCGIMATSAVNLEVSGGPGYPGCSGGAGTGLRSWHALALQHDRRGRHVSARRGAHPATSCQGGAHTQAQQVLGAAQACASTCGVADSA